MTIDSVTGSSRRTKPTSRRLSLNRSRHGGCIVSGLNSPDRQFANVAAALDGVRNDPIDTRPQTIEVWHGDEYICSLPLGGPADDAFLAPSRHAGRPASMIERCANRAAQIVMAITGPIFWLALVGIVLAASFGWRLFIF